MIDLASSDVRFGIARSISYGLFGPPDGFMPALRDLGAGLVRVYFYWSQVEPEPGRVTFDAVDAFLDQLHGSEEVWVTLCSSSPWATRVPATFLPPSQAKDPDAYDRFVRTIVRRCGGRVDFWQCDNEPSNVGLTWAGTAEEYVQQLRAFRRAIRDEAPDAAVVLGGAPYGLPAAPEESAERRFFDVLLREGAGSFDLFDLHLYQDAGRIPQDVETIRATMRAHGYETPVVAGEYNAPWPNLFPEAEAAMREALAAAMAAPAEGESAERIAMTGLYERMTDLPPQLQMFMTGCPKELEDRRDRINRREIVMRNVLALAAGVRRTVCWNLAPDIPNYTDPLSVMDLLFGKLALMGYEGTELRRRPAADAFGLVTQHLSDAESVTHVEVPERPSMYVFEVRRSGRGPLLVAWDRRDSFSGEDEPPVLLHRPWPSYRAHVVDALGRVGLAEAVDGLVTLPVSVTPIFASAT